MNIGRLRDLAGRFRNIGPGVVMAATGIGASDFFTGIWAGSQAGRGVLWAVLFGAVLKYYLTEGIARRQILTGESFVHLWLDRSRILRWMLPVYFAVWSVCVFSLLLGATGLAASQFLPLLFDSPRATVAVYGIAQGALIIGLLSLRGYSHFEKIVHILVGLTAATILYSLASAGPRAFVFSRPEFDPGHSVVILAILTGIGGTLTLLGYGGWIREKGYVNAEHVTVMRLDCALGYVITALLMTAMILLSDTVLRPMGVIANSESAAKSVFKTLGSALSGLPGGQSIFAAGFWCIVISSMTGVWQSVPVIFSEGAQAVTNRANRNIPTIYRISIFACASLLMFFEIPVLFLTYAIVSALFMPFLAGSLLYHNNRSLPHGFKNSIPANAVLLSGFLLFAWIGFRETARILGF